MTTAREPLHRPSLDDIRGSQLTAFLRACEAETGDHFPDHAAFHQFSVDQLRPFWSLFLRFSGLLHDGSPEPVCQGDACETATFFPNLRLSYVENLLRLDATLDAARPALLACHPSGRRERLTRGELRERVEALARALTALGVAPGDRVVAVAYNDASAVIAGLGALAVGATLSTASPDMGTFSILGRFAQLDPVVLFCHVEDLDPDAAVPLATPLATRLAELQRGLPSLKAIIALDDGPTPPDLGVPVHALSALSRPPEGLAAPFTFRRFPFNHPLFILFSSGTTGPPKCIVHGAGGTLLEHLKEHRLHGDLRPGDRLFFYTSCAWMMWNWQLSALAAGAEIVLHAGAIKQPDTLWSIVAEARVTTFGTSPAYLQMSEDAAYSPARALPLDALRVILSTGSILHDHQYDWAREHVGPIPLQSISGGTDILGCFVLGNPNLPSYRGESQCRSLGMDVQALGPGGVMPPSGVGELVCRTPFPSRPLGFHGDAGQARFHEAYFSQNPGVWTHGDWIALSAEGTARMFGRSDGVLNVRGVRIGPAEIYRILQSVPAVQESLAVEQRLPGSAGQRLVLLVVLRAGAALDSALKRTIRRELGSRGSAGHVPELILAVPELPVTHSGKRSERAARDALSGVEVANAGALRNPESLTEIRRALAQEEARRVEARKVASPIAAPTKLAAQVAGAWERVLDRGSLSPDEDFFDLGGTSMLALRLCNEVLERTGCELPPSTLFEAPTIERMAAAIVELRAQPLSPVVVLKAGGRDRPLFFVHGLGGDILELRALAQRIDGNRPVIGLRAGGLDPREPSLRTVEAMATAYVAHVRRSQPEGPYALVGYSFGGLVAFEMARRLKQSGQEVELLGLLDTNMHDACLPPIARASYRTLRRLHWATTRITTPLPPALSARREALTAWIEARLHVTSRDATPAPFLREELTPRMAALEALAWQAFYAYRPTPYPGVVTFFRASERPRDYFYPIPLWTALAGGRLSICDVPGSHFTMIRAPHVEALARCLGERLRP